MTNETIQQFELFGSIGDAALRRRLTEQLHAALQQNGKADLGFSDAETDNFATAFAEIINGNEVLRELCAQDAALATEITAEILAFVENTQKEILRKSGDLYDEQVAIETTDATILAELPKVTRRNTSKRDEFWNEKIAMESRFYQKNELNLAFYRKEFEKASTAKTEIIVANIVENIAVNTTENTTENVANTKISVESIKAHFIENWQKHFQVKKAKHELAIIDEARKKFCEDLYKRIYELKKLQEILAPFTNELGRLWDMSKGNFQRANFDLLKHFAELLKNDKTLAELIEMLGKMRTAEQELEEETYSETVLKTKWKPVHAYRGDIAGIHESDDLNSMLPSEAALLSDHVLETVFYKKFAEKKLQTFEYQNKTAIYEQENQEKKRQKPKETDKGPFIICVDTSGSMHGTPENVAKTLCFAMIKKAIQELRKCYLISFSTSIETLDLGDFKNSLEKLIHFLGMSFHGGTDATPAMHEAMRMLNTNEYKKADVLMISDFVMPAFDENMQNQLAKARANDTKFHSLVIGASNNQRATADFDNTWLYNSNTGMKGLITALKKI